MGTLGAGFLTRVVVGRKRCAEMPKTLTAQITLREVCKTQTIALLRTSFTAVLSVAELAEEDRRSSAAQVVCRNAVVVDVQALKVGGIVV